MMWCANELDGVELACGFPEITVFFFYPILLVLIIFLKRTMNTLEQYTYTQRCDMVQSLSFFSSFFLPHWLGLALT